MPTYHVTPAGAGTHSGADKANAFTMEEACDAVIAGDLVHVYGDSGDYTAEYDTGGAKDCVLYIATNGSVGSPIVWQGCYSTAGDGGIAVIDASTNTLAYGIYGAASNHNVFKNLQIENATSHGVGNGLDNCTFKNVRSTNNGGSGFFVDDYNQFINCSADNNDSLGFSTDIFNNLISCIAYANGSEGIQTDSGTAVIGCLLYGNGNGNNITIVGYGCCVVNCTIDGENQAASVGIYCGGTLSGFVAVNNIIHDCNVGISCGTDFGEEAIASNNLFNSNNTNTSNFLAANTTAIESGGQGDVSAVPAFNNEAGDDYTLDSGSGAVNTGIDAGYTDAYWDSFIAANNPPTP